MSKRDKWRPVLNGEDRYRVSRFGDVYSRLRGRLPGYVNPGGYPVVSLSIGGKRRVCLIHRLVYEAFNGPIPERMVINHIDGNKKNAELDNLEAVTPAQNTKHAWDCGLIGRAPSEKLPPRVTLPTIPTFRAGKVLVTVSAIEFLAGLRRWRLNRMNAMTAEEAAERARDMPEGGIGVLSLVEETELDRDMAMMSLREKQRRWAA